jgi:hypothetical protein
VYYDQDWLTLIVAHKGSRDKQEIRMATMHHPQHHAHSGERTSTFDHELSQRLDVLIIALEAESSSVRRLWLRAQKWHLERHIPEFRREVQR